MLEKSVGVQKIEVYVCSHKKIRLFYKKKDLKPAQEPPVQSFQHKKVPIILILATFGGGHITSWLGADFEETHFFLGRPVPTSS